MGNFIDVHNHLAWGIDDGMENKENAENALRSAKDDGINELIVTPHFIPEQYSQADIDRNHQRVLELIELARTFDIQVSEGAELFLNNEYLDVLDQHRCPSLAASRYLLCEFNVRNEISHDGGEAEDKLYEIKIRKYVPVIAHVERYFHSKIDLERISSWINMGYVIQVNRTSLLGMHGAVCKENAIRLLEHNMVHIVASDAHRCNGSRVCKLSDAYEYIAKHYGQDNAEILCCRNPKHILNDEALETINVKKHSLFKRLFGRS